ncbi:MAG: hypothetical protein E2O58_10740 [Gammaproteobacteria bacterium]|nr:MAG: hypothetical protein E2O75_05875 [Chloroflexota bacterium]TDJ22680.1 MAG: hypothetical protein E2O58_10740 [Gammaproteobacteria bacterium]
MQNSYGTLAKPILASVALTILVGLSWTGTLDARSRIETEQALETTLISYAIARTLNGLISVAQGTEIALQPAGVGIVLTAGEILDPLNDLVEKFSWVVLLAALSLAMQLLIGEILTTNLLNIVTTAAAAASVLLCWKPSIIPVAARAFVFRATTLLLTLRFAVVAAGFSMSLIGSQYLDDREHDAIDYLSATQAAIEAPDAREGIYRRDSGGLLEQLDSFIEAQKESFDLNRRLDRLQRQIENAINVVINLIVIYVLKTLLVPLATLAVLYGSIRYCWRKIGQ